MEIRIIGDPDEIAELISPKRPNVNEIIKKLSEKLEESLSDSQAN